jgi:hypothetical protein
MTGPMMNDTLGPLPEPANHGHGDDDVIVYYYTADQMRAYALAEVAKERERERLKTGGPMTEGELWSWVRSVMCQGADIRADYDAGVHKGYEAYSARLDAAAAERADQLLARLTKLNTNQAADNAT